MTTIQQLVGIAAQQHEIVKRVGNGTLDPADVKRQLQAIIERKSASATGSNIYVEKVRRQLEILSKNYGVTLREYEIDHLLGLATRFVPRTDSDEPLITGALLSERGRESADYNAKHLFDIFKSPADYGTLNRLLGHTLRFTNQRRLDTKARLIHFDPLAYKGLSPLVASREAKLDGVKLAGLEVLEMLLLNPEFFGLWIEGQNYSFYLSDLAHNIRAEDWDYNPVLERPGDSRTIMLSSDVHHKSPNRVRFSPAIVEC